jgi:urea ABC transporter urea binding protein
MFHDLNAKVFRYIRTGLVVMLAGSVLAGCAKATDREPIKIGVLNSLTGTMSFSEIPNMQTVKLAVDELNAKGGVLGRKVEAVVADGKSDWPTFAQEAERLLTKEKVSAVFGTWTAASRRTVKPVFEKYNGLLFHPLEYEGLEESPNIIYTGSTPNQHSMVAVKWAFDNIGRTFFIVGSDYVYPRSTGAIVREQIQALGGKILGEEYVLLGRTDFKATVQKIIDTKPAAILNTINGDSNVAFFNELRARGITSEKIPTFSFSIAEPELNSIGPKLVAGDYAVWDYFQSIDSPENRDFVKRVKSKLGADHVVSDPMEASYNGVYLWAKAVTKAKTDDVTAVREAIKGIDLDAPEGKVTLDLDNNNLWKSVRIGKMQDDGQFKIIWESGKLIQPVPYPKYRTREAWDNFLQTMYEGWGKTWSNPRVQ